MQKHGDNLRLPPGAAVFQVLWYSEALMMGVSGTSMTAVLPRTVTVVRRLQAAESWSVCEGDGREAGF